MARPPVVLPKARNAPPNPRAVVGGNKPKLNLAADAAADKKLKPDRLAAINRLGAELVQIDLDQRELSARLEGLQTRRTEIETKELTKLMAGAAPQLTLPDGNVIGLRKTETVRLPSAEEEPDLREEAIDHLRQVAPDLLKNVIVVPFDKGQEKRATALKTVLNKFKYAFAERPDVHWATLQSWFLEQMAAGKPIKTKLFKHFTVEKVELNPKGKVKKDK